MPKEPLVTQRKPLVVEKTVRVEWAKAVARYLRDRELADCSKPTLRWYSQKLGQLGEALKVEYVDRADKDALLDFISALKDRGLSRTYVRNWYQVFRGFFGWCRSEGYAIHPSLVLREGGKSWFALKKPPEPEVDRRAFTEEELERIIDAAESPRNRIFLKVLIGTGLRLQEALGLALEDFEEGRLRVRLGKGRKSRSVPLSASLERELTRYIERVRPEARTDHLFLSRDGRPWSQSAVFSMFNRLQQRTRLPIHAHALRHHFATTYMENGGDIDRLRRILGHSTFKMSSHYARSATADLDKDFDVLTRPRR